MDMLHLKNVIVPYTEQVQIYWYSWTEGESHGNNRDYGKKQETIFWTKKSYTVYQSFRQIINF